MAHTDTLSRTNEVMIVDDNPVQLLMLSSILADQGMPTRTFQSADEALGALSSGPSPNLIITDLYMPGIDGWRFCRLLRSPEFATCNKVPILVVSGTYSGADADRISAELGANAFLPMPVDASRLRECVASLLRGEKTCIVQEALIVESDRTLRNALRQVFEAHGYNVRTASTASEGSRLFRIRVPDVAVIDHQLSDAPGDKLLREFKDENRQITAIMITSDPSPAIARHLMLEGAAAHVRKPFDLNSLVLLCEKARRERSLLRLEDLLEDRTRELREGEERLRTLINAMPDVVCFKDGEGRWLEANHPYLRLLGLEGIDYRGKLRRDVMEADHDPTSANCEKTDEQAWREGVPVRFEQRVVRQEGSIRVLDVIKVPTFEADGKRKGLVVVGRDITAMKSAEDEKLELQRQLIQAQKMESVGRLAGGIAHDMNNLLTPVIGYAEMILQQLWPDHPVYDQVNVIRDASYRAKNLVRQLLAFSRKQLLDMKVVDLNHVVSSLQAILRRTIPESVEIEIGLALDPKKVLADVSQLEQIIMNLAVNSHDAMPDGGKLAIRTSQVIIEEDGQDARSGPPRGSYATLTVEDTGSGMNQETLRQIFEPFFTTKETGKGTGLGLSTVYGIVKQHQGYIYARSEVGHGTSFEIHLPQVQGAAAPLAEPPTAAVHPGGGAEMVLVVEDNHLVRELTVDMLRKQGYRVLDAETPRQALDVVREHTGSVDLLLTDVVMPGMNGRELYTRMVETMPHLKVLYMSGYTEDVITRHGVIERDTRFIQKPFSVYALCDAVRKVLDGVMPHSPPSIIP